MKNLIAELLVKLADKEQESKELVAQVEALEIIVTAMLRHIEPETQRQIVQHIETALPEAAQRETVNQEDMLLLQQYIKKLLHYPRI